MNLAIIVAVAHKGVIGRDNRMPWHLPNDLKYFKRLTLGKPVIMGRKTFESIGKPLPGRANIVITRQQGWCADGVEAVHNLDDAISLAEVLTHSNGADEAMIIGGAQLYNESLIRANRLYLTEVAGDFDGDTYFPVIDQKEWRELLREEQIADDDNLYDHTFLVFERVTPKD